MDGKNADIIGNEAPNSKWTSFSWQYASALRPATRLTKEIGIHKFALASTEI
jgi:hypothetical protein